MSTSICNKNGDIHDLTDRLLDLLSANLQCLDPTWTFGECMKDQYSSLWDWANGQSHGPGSHKLDSLLTGPSMLALRHVTQTLLINIADVTITGTPVSRPHEHTDCRQAKAFRLREAIAKAKNTMRLERIHEAAEAGPAILGRSRVLPEVSMVPDSTLMGLPAWSELDGNSKLSWGIFRELRKHVDLLQSLEAHFDDEIARRGGAPPPTARPKTSVYTPTGQAVMPAPPPYNFSPIPALLQRDIKTVYRPSHNTHRHAPNSEYGLGQQPYIAFPPSPPNDATQRQQQQQAPPDPYFWQPPYPLRPLNIPSPPGSIQVPGRAPPHDFSFRAPNPFLTTPLASTTTTTATNFLNLVPNRRRRRPATTETTTASSGSGPISGWIPSSTKLINNPRSPPSCGITFVNPIMHDNDKLGKDDKKEEEEEEEEEEEKGTTRAVVEAKVAAAGGVENNVICKKGEKGEYQEGVNDDEDAEWVTVYDAGQGCKSENENEGWEVVY
ncbi:hypothetical protein QBC44DRAFT_373245 [Cladorrhinum sp. PSN332]|nr:hypothetical protein QBC44DRAFT_373245 [Cladorrhinum sp. PSN332]